jgi:predicted DNA-binding protein YlxM (UPF0122 family)
MPPTDPMPDTALSYEELKDEAHRLAKDDSRAYTEIAEELDVTKSAVAQAVTTTGPKFHRLQIRIVELLSSGEVEPRKTFILRLNE